MSTIKDIAKATGLSIATISKYINGGKLKEKNRVLVEKAVKDLDYKVSNIARSLKTKKTMTIGVCLPLLESLFFTKIISIIEDILLSNGYSTIICDYREDKQLERKRLEFLMSKNVDGIIMIPSSLSANDVRDVITNDTPFVLLDRSIKDLTCDSILVDNINAAYQSVEELIVRKHRLIGIIVGPEIILTAKERLKGYDRALEDYGIKKDPQLVKIGDNKIESGYRLLNELMDKDKPPSAVVVTNYEMTIGAMIAINERNISIPDELSFLGFDNMQLSQIVKPRLTLVIQPMERIGVLAAETLLKRLSGNYDDYPVFMRLKTETIIGESISIFNEQ